jgi:hypothetical protein
MAYATTDQWAIQRDYASFAAYNTANPNAVIEAKLTALLDKATSIINRNIGSYSTSVTSSVYTTDLKYLCIEMVDRMLQINFAEGKTQNIPMFSPNDYLVERERENLRSIGKILGYRKVGRLVF